MSGDTDLLFALCALIALNAIVVVLAYLSAHRESQRTSERAS
jgi:hypothetical protein